MKVTIRTEDQMFNRLLDYQTTEEVTNIIYALHNRTVHEDYIFECIVEVLGNETTNDKIDEFLLNRDKMIELVGWNFIDYESFSEQISEDELSWNEISYWDERC